MSKFEVGDDVKWSSSANGSQKEKQGTVIKVIPARAPSPNRTGLEKEFPGANAAGIDGSSAGRDHESYVVSVPGLTKRGKPKLYWPRVSALELVHSF